MQLPASSIAGALIIDFRTVPEDDDDGGNIPPL